MAVIFTKAVGQVASFPDPTLPANISLRVEDWGGFFNFKSIITRITISAKGNYQFLHTLGGQVYVYVFGDRIGDLVLQGFAFDSVCGNPVGLLGIESVLNYYSANRIAARKTPLRITIGASTTLRAYLLDVAGDVQDTKSRMWQFSLHLALIPRDVETDSTSSSDSDEDTESTEETTGEDTSEFDDGAITFAEAGFAAVRPPKEFAEDLVLGGPAGTGEGVVDSIGAPVTVAQNGRIQDPSAVYPLDSEYYASVDTGPKTGIVTALP
jgi:hypothetical protein